MTIIGSLTNTFRLIDPPDSVSVSACVSAYIFTFQHMNVNGQVSFVHTRVLKNDWVET